MWQSIAAAAILLVGASSYLSQLLGYVPNWVASWGLAVSVGGLALLPGKRVWEADQVRLDATTTVVRMKDSEIARLSAIQEARQRPSVFIEGEERSSRIGEAFARTAALRVFNDSDADIYDAEIFLVDFLSSDGKPVGDVRTCTLHWCGEERPRGASGPATIAARSSRAVDVLCTESANSPLFTIVADNDGSRQEVAYGGYQVCLELRGRGFPSIRFTVSLRAEPPGAVGAQPFCRVESGRIELTRPSIASAG